MSTPEYYDHGALVAVLTTQPLGKALDYMWHIALPVTASTIAAFAMLTLLTKNSFLDEIKKQYVITARAKGLSENRVLYGHVFPIVRRPNPSSENIVSISKLPVKKTLTKAAGKPATTVSIAFRKTCP